jgi:hypothetical protein
LGRNTVGAAAVVAEAQKGRKYLADHQLQTMSKRPASETHPEEPPAKAQHTRAESVTERIMRQIRERDMKLDPCLRIIQVQGETQNEKGEEVIENRDFLVCSMNF